jgi:hypothetical protein
MVLSAQTNLLAQAPKLEYRHTDNLNYFFRFLDKVGLPKVTSFALCSQKRPSLISVPDLPLRDDRLLRCQEHAQGVLLSPLAKV